MSTQNSQTHPSVTGIGQATPADVRTSTERADELRQYILGLLPAHLSTTVDVVITSQVPTAAVLPATEEALITADQTEFDRQQARQLIDAVDGDYLVLITNRPPPKSGPVKDELALDRAHQFGLAFHETLHILKTAFSGIQRLLSTEVDEPYRKFVHGLINATEDGAIEHEVYVGEDFSANAGNRLRLVRGIHKRAPEDYTSLPPERSEFTFGDALQKGLHDNVILPPSGTTRALLDDDDDRVRFRSAEERAAFEAVYPEIEALASDIHALRGDAGKTLHRNDLEASIGRAKRTIRFWHEVVKPLTNSEDVSSPPEGGKQSSEGETTTGKDSESELANQSLGSPRGEQSDTPPEENDCGEQPNSSPSTKHEQETQPNPEEDQSAQFEPEDLSLDSNAVEDSMQGVGNRPSMMDEPEPEDVTQPQSVIDDSSTPADDSAGTSSPEAPSTDSCETDSCEGTSEPSDGTDEQRGAAQPEDLSESNQPPDSPELPGESEVTQSADEQSQTPPENTSESDSESTTASELAASTSSQPDGDGQSTFDDFLGDNGSESERERSEADSKRNEATDEAESESSVEGQHERSTDSRDVDEVDPPKGGHDPSQTDSQNGELGFDQSANLDETQEASGQSTEEGPSSEPGPENAPPSQATPSTGSGSESTPTPEPLGKSDEQGTPSSTQELDVPSQSSTEENAQSASSNDDPSPDPIGPDAEGEDLTAEDFESDSKRAKRTAEDLSIDTRSLETELEDLDSTLSQNQPQQPNRSGGSGAGPGSVSELQILPTPAVEDVPEIDWEDVEKSSDNVAHTLANVLRLSQQTSARTGLTSGTIVNQKTAHRLAYGDPRIFERSIEGEEKEYFIIIVLDRSGSMDPHYLPGQPRPPGPSKISVATSSVARLAVACESLGIDVAVVDFYDENARLAKPASIDSEYAQETLLSTEVAGGTPLADSLSLATSLAETDSRESIIITMTDGKPRDVDEVGEVIKASYAPICSLTIATDCEFGDPPEKAQELDPLFDQTTTVYDPEALDDRLDEFASLLGAY